MIIIGGGSAGLFLAGKSENKITGKAEKIFVIEEHNKLGLPVQCTGILTDEINSLVGKNAVKKFAINTIARARIFSPNAHVDLKIKNNIIIDNVKFVEYLADRAEKNKLNDVRILTSHRYISNSGAEIKVKNLETEKIKIFRDSILIGADGPQSKVAVNNNLNSKREYLLGIQARVKIKDLDKNRIDFYPHIGEYAWSTPENDEISRVGVAIPLENQKNRNVSTLKNKLFEDFLKKYPGKKLEIQAGLIPLHKPGIKISACRKDFSAALLGDAAGQIKNTTGGGIIPGLKAADELSKGINNYQHNLKHLNRELYFHYLLNKSFQKYSDKDWDRLIVKVKNENIQHTLETVNRDNLGKLLFSLATKKGMISEGLTAMRKLI
jgi:digeranylgeranylglycerophospholipid reductase